MNKFCRKVFTLVVCFIIIYMCRGQSTFSPLDIPGLTLWLRADSGLVRNGNNVTQWNDLSGNNYNAVQSNLSYCPDSVMPLEFCGKPAVRFNGVHDLLTGMQIPGIDVSSLSIFILAKGNQTAATNRKGIFTVGQVASGLWLHQGETAQTYNLRNNNSPLAGGSLPLAGFPYTLLGMNKDYGASATLYRNGALAGTSTNSILTGPFTNASYTLGYASAYFTGEIAEVIIYAANLDFNQRRDVENYFYAKYSPPPVNLGADIIQPYSLCPVNLSAGNCYVSYQWSTGETTSSIQTEHSGVFSVTVTDVFGATSSDTVNVTMPSPNLTQNDTVICAGALISMASQLSGASGYTFLWQNASTSPSIVVGNSGEYFVIVSDTSVSSCSLSSDTMSLIVDSFYSTVSLGADRTLCGGESLILASPASGWSNLSFNWSNAVNDSFIIISNPGQYAVTVTNQFGCSGSDIVNIDIRNSVPLVDFSADTICFGQSYVPQNYSLSSDTTSIVRYLWDFGNSDTLVAINPIYNYSAAGSYNVSLTAQTDSGCSNTKVKTILVKPSPVASFDVLDACIGNPYSFSDSSLSVPGYSINQWSWSFGDLNSSSFQNPTHVYSAPGTYSVTLRAFMNNGCSDSVIKNLAVVANSPLPSSPTAISPANNFSLTNTIVNFVWNSALNTSGYTLFVDVDPLFANPSIFSNLNSTEFTLPLAANQTYYWRIASYNICGDSSLSGTYVFHIFSPEFLSNLALWLRADTGIEVSTGRVRRWNDIAGSNDSAVQASSARRPVLINTSDFCGKPTVYFDGSSRFLNGTTISGLNTSSLSVFIVAKGYPAVSAAPKKIWGAGSISSGLWLYQGESPQSYVYRNNSNTRLLKGGDLPLTGFPYTLLGMNKEYGGRVKLFKNSLQTADTNDAILCGTFTNSAYSIGTTATPFFNGEIAEIIIYQRSLDANERNTVENYLYSKYAPPVNLGKDTTIAYSLCPITIQASGCFKSFLWSTGDTTNQIQTRGSGDYWVQATDVFGRVSRDTMKVIFPPVNLNYQDTTICSGGVVYLETQLNGTPGYVFLWQDSLTIPYRQVSNSGDYYLTVRDTASGCFLQSDTFTLTISNLSVSVSLGPDRTLCNGQTLTLSNPVSGWENLSFSWSTNSSDSVIVVNTPGTYSVSVINQIGCSGIDTVVLNLKNSVPVASFSNDSICFGQAFEPINSSYSRDTSVIVAYLWNFGNTDTSILPNPSYYFQSSGVYSVSLRVETDSGCSSALIQSVVVKPSPVAMFDVATACVGNPYSFVDSSVSSPDYPLIQWTWDFGDTTLLSSIQNPQHTYQNVNNVTVTLTITAQNGCSDSVSKPLSIVSTFDTPSGPSLIIPADSFISATNNITFSWDPASDAIRYQLQIAYDTSFVNIFNQVNTALTTANATLADITTFYWRVMAYNICSETNVSVWRRISVFRPNLLSGNKLWLAADQGIVLNQDSGSVATWSDFSGSGQTAVQTSPSSQPSYITNVPCLNNKPVLRFNGTNDFLQILSFTAASPMTTFVVWNSNGTNAQTQFVYDGANAPNPSLYYSSNNIYLSGGSQIYYSHPVPREYLITAGIYNTTNSSLYENSIQKVSGTVGSAPLSFSGLNLGVRQSFSSYLKGDIAEVIVYDTPLSPPQRLLVENYLRFKYSPPPVSLGPDIKQVHSLCPVSLNAGGCYAKYLWSTNDSIPNINVSKTGKYWVRVTDFFGGVSSDSVYVDFPYSGMNIKDSAICAGNVATVIPLLNDTGYTFQWSTGSQSAYTLTDTAGVYSVVISDGSCTVNSDSAFVSIDSFSFYSLFPADTGICIGNEIAVAPYLYPATSYLWSTGDTTPRINVDSATSYSVTVTDVNSCVASGAINVFTTGVAPITNFITSNGCTGKPIVFIDSSVASSDSSDFITNWYWNFGDGTSDSVPNTSHAYDTISSYDVTLFIATNDGCTGTVMKNIKVFAYPTAGFTTQPQVICAETTVQLQDNSSIAGTTFLSNWHWKINNTDTFNAKNPFYSFTARGLTPLELVVTTAQGCSDTLFDTLEVFPSLSGDFGFTKPCLGEVSQFTDLTPVFSIVKWQWNFGDNTPASFLQNPAHKYAQPGPKTVNLIIENAIGCVDTIIKAVLVVDTPTASFTGLSGCENDLYAPQNTSTYYPNEPITNWYWEIGNTVYANDSAPQHQFPGTGVYQVKLRVTTSPNGCVDSVVKQVTIDANPSSYFTFTPLYGEAPLEVEFNNLSTDADNYDWNFGDNSLNSSDRNPTHTFLENDTFNISLFAVSDAGCAAIYTRQIVVIPTELDIAVETVTAKSITQPDGTIVTKITATLRNLGSRLITTAKLYATIDGEGLIAEDMDSLLLPGYSIDYVFAAGFVTTASNGNEYVCVEAKSVNSGETETRLDNNKQCTSLTGTIQLIGPVPNPAYGQSALGIILPRKGIVNVAIIDAIGRYVLPEEQVALPEGRSDYWLPVNQMMAAEYFIRIRYNDDIFVKKLVVK